MNLPKHKYTFVIRPFKKSFTNFYQNKFGPAWDTIRAPKLPKLIDAMEYHSSTINEKVKDFIRNASFIICDATTNSPNIYWEFAYAEAIGKPFILFCRTDYKKQKEEELAADINGYETKRYSRHTNVTSKDYLADIKTSYINAVQDSYKKIKYKIINRDELLDYLDNTTDFETVFVSFLAEPILNLTYLNRLKVKEFVFHFDNSGVTKTKSFQKLLKKNNKIFLTPLKLWTNFIAINEIHLLISISNKHFILISKTESDFVSNTIISFLQKYSILIKHKNELNHFAENLDKVCLKEIKSIQKKGFSFFNDSQFWYKTPEIIIREYLDDTKKKVLWCDLQKSINVNFSNYAKNLLADKKTKYVYTMWPLLVNSSSLELAKVNTLDKKKQAYWVKEWLKDLDAWYSKKNGESIRYLIVSGTVVNTRKFFIKDQEYRTSIVRMLKFFLRCSYSKSIYVIPNSNLVFDRIFNTQNNQLNEIARSNFVLFSNKMIEEESLDGHLQIEEKIPIFKSSETILNFRFFNLDDEKCDDYKKIIRLVNQARKEDYKIRENIPCIYSLKNFYDSFFNEKK